MADHEHRSLNRLASSSSSSSSVSTSRSLVGSVENQQVGRHGEQLGEEQAVTLAAGKRVHRNPEPVRFKEEIHEVAGHMPLLPLMVTVSLPFATLSMTDFSGSSEERS